MGVPIRRGEAQRLGLRRPTTLTDALEGLLSWLAGARRVMDEERAQRVQWGPTS